MHIGVAIYFLLKAPASRWAEALLCSGLAQAGLLGGRCWLRRGGRWPWWSAGPRCRRLGKWTLKWKLWAWCPGSTFWWLLRASLPKLLRGDNGGARLGGDTPPQHAVLWAAPPTPLGLQASCAGSAPAATPRGHTTVLQGGTHPQQSPAVTTVTPGFRELFPQSYRGSWPPRLSTGPTPTLCWAPVQPLPLPLGTVPLSTPPRSPSPHVGSGHQWAHGAAS